MLFIEVDVMEQDESIALDALTHAAQSVKAYLRDEGVAANVAVTTDAGERYSFV